MVQNGLANHSNYGDSDLTRRIYIHTSGVMDTYFQLLEKTYEQQCEDATRYLQNAYIAPYHIRTQNSASPRAEHRYSDIVRSCLIEFERQIKAINSWEAIVKEYTSVPKSGGGNTSTNAQLIFDDAMSDACSTIANYVNKNDIHVPYISRAGKPNFSVCASISVIHFGRLLKMEEKA